MDLVCYYPIIIICILFLPYHPYLIMQFLIVYSYKY